LPDDVSISISGWPSIFDSVRAKVVRKGGRTDQVDLTLSHVEGSILRGALGPSANFTFPETPGAALGTLYLKDGAPFRFRRSARLAQYTTKVLEALSDP
jgi:hypothetical protein